MRLSLYFHISVISCSGASVVSPETAAAAQTLLQCHDNSVSTGHARRLSEGVANLEPYDDCKPNQYNQSSKVQKFEVGDHVACTLQLNSERRWTLDLKSWSSTNSALMVINYAVSMVWCKGSSALTS